jgi:predicted acyl esterase
LRRWAVLILCAVIFQLPEIAVAQSARVSFARTEAMIRMRDGVKLHTVILTPQTQAEPLPILMTRTPYGVNDWTSDSLNLEFQEFAADGYTFVFQDIRGKFESEGQFVMVRPPRDKRDAKSIDESTDTYDTIDWLIKNGPRNNGRVGIMGGSYDGWLATMSLIDPHPARYLNSFEKAEALVPDRVNQYKIDLHGNDYAFLKGHRIMVQVQSSWFPLYDRNPQKFVPNIFLAQESDFQRVTQRIYRSSNFPSRVSVSVALR